MNTSILSISLRSFMLLAMMFSTPAIAQQADPAPFGGQSVVVDPYVELVQAIADAAGPDRLFEQSLQQLRSAMLNQNPDTAAMEQEYPGIVDQMVAAMKPGLRRHTDRTASEFSKRAATLIATALTQEEARDAAAFYRSPVGRRLINAVAENYSYKEVFSEAIEGYGEEDISIVAVQSDFKDTIEGAMKQVTTADQLELLSRRGKDAWLPKLQALQPQMLALRVEVENMPILPQEEAEMEQAVAAVVERAVSQELAK